MGEFPNDADCHLPSSGAGRSCRGDSLRGESILAVPFRNYYRWGAWAMSSAIAAIFAYPRDVVGYVVKETKDPLDI